MRMNVFTNWGLKNIILNDSLADKTTELIQDAEDAGHFLWVNEFLGSHQDYERLHLWYIVLATMFDDAQYLVEVRDDLLFVLFDTASNAILFRFALAEQTA
jgi:hypothetical protein